MTAILEGPPAAPLDKVEWRPQGKPSNGRCQFVPYLSASTVAALLDGWAGPDGWQDEYEPGKVNGRDVMWCRLTIGAATKTDLGVASNFEGEKGAVSDAFKRAATLKWGAGRNVYDLPIVWAPCRVDQKGNPWPTNATLPAIRAELEKRGVSSDAAQRTSVDDGHHAEPADESQSRVEVEAAEAALDEIAQAAPEFYAAEVEPKRDALVRFGANGAEHLDRMVSRLVKEQAEWEDAR